MSDIDKALSEAYKKSKRQYAAPSRIQRQVMREAEKQKPALPEWFNRETLSMGAAAFVLAVLIVIYNMSDIMNTANPSHIVDVNIEFHAYEEERPSFDVGQYREQLTAYENSYRQQLTQLDVHSLRLARLEQVEDGWALSDCNDVSIKISDRLVEDLKSLNRISPGLTVGDQVQLALNKDGLILGISYSKAPLTC